MSFSFLHTWPKPTPSPSQKAPKPLEVARLKILQAAKDRATKLDLRRHDLSEVPHEIAQCTELTHLDISGNRISTLPQSIQRCSKLESLDASKNNLNSFKLDFGSLDQLKLLDLEDNGFIELPHSLCGCHNLQTLLLRNNRLTSLPNEIGLCSTLRHLDLRGNRLITLPTSLGNCTNLRAIYLSANRLSSLPDEIGALASLEILHLEANNLISLPEGLKQLQALRALYLSRNSRLNLPPEVTGRTWNETGDDHEGATAPQAILDYYFARQLEGQRPLNQVKLLLVGRGEAGKTSISRALRGELFNKEEKETPGIDIQSWTAECKSGQVAAHLWDFAGQEITHETHRSFLTRRSLYLIVLDGRGGQQMEDAEYWLGHVEKYGGDDSPVIIVLNKWETLGSYEIERRRLQREHPRIRKFVSTDCATGYGIQDLHDCICDVIDKMDGVRQTWPLSYFKVSQELRRLAEEERRHFLPWEEYKLVCERGGINTRERQEWLAENLHALGIALYYGDNERLRDTRVLNPNWAANGLYGLLRGVQRRPRCNHPGEFLASEMGDVLKTGLEGMNRVRGADFSDYDKPGVNEFLLALMLDRELGFRAGGDSGREVYLLPGLLPTDEPDPEKYDLGYHIENATIKLRWLYELLPAGIISRLIVRTHFLSDHLFRWQRGHVLGWMEARALVVAEKRRNPRVDVFITGGTASQQQAIAGIIRSNMEAIHGDLPIGLRGREELDISSVRGIYEETDKLKQLEQSGQPLQVVTPLGPVNIEVTPELERIQPRRARSNEAPRLRIFVSYSHHNYRQWDKFKVHLDILLNERLIVWWFDGKIRPGANWEHSIRHELLEADIVVMLISPGFFASKYIQGVEMKEAIARHEQGLVRVLPVLVEESPAFNNHEWLKDIQASPVINGSLLALNRVEPRIAGWNVVEQALRALIEDVHISKDIGGDHAILGARQKGG